MHLVKRLVSAVAYATLLARAASTQASGSAVLGRDYTFPSLKDATLDHLGRGLNDGLFTSAHLVKTYMKRIHQVNEQLHAVTEINPDALDIAAHLDKQRASGCILGRPLHGIPILIKNNIATADRMNNTGTYCCAEPLPRDATVASKLRQAGAIILGKANLSQWANFRSQNPTNGWSAHGGQVYGAYHEKQDPSGSSSGSGVAADLGLAFAALGSETDGSILGPASANNVVGIKPTLGLTSRHLVIPISERLDTVGPLARTVRDAAYLLQAIAGPDPRDKATTVSPPQVAKADYVAACNDKALQGARIGVPWNVIEMFGPAEPFQTASFVQAVEVLRQAGATIVTSNFTQAKEISQSAAALTVMMADFSSNLDTYLAELTCNPNQMRGLADVLAWTHSHVQEEWPQRDTNTWQEIIDTKASNTDPRFWSFYTQALQVAARGGLLGAIETHCLDAVVLPTFAAPEWAALVGAPAINVPLGYYPADTPVKMDQTQQLVVQGPNMPFGMTFLGAKWTEERLIGLAHSYEQHTGTRGQQRQQVVPTAELASEPREWLKRV
ncbi:hypothetical protein CDD81_4761 [Ophiocordyceps australis]|uniref:Amidase domain-containing protein n=1 Tax=Ophiocordyceps australis TaxID=1399860 RepID=A0A2C5Y6F2_9HYPO|nr:hypothetical protein CDD81_4761 [Ophiocordyceps australis]